MISNLTELEVSILRLGRAAQDDNEPVRKGEFDDEIANHPTVAQFNALTSDGTPASAQVQSIVISARTNGTAYNDVSVVLTDQQAEIATYNPTTKVLSVGLGVATTVSEVIFMLSEEGTFAGEVAPGCSANDILVNDDFGILAGGTDPVIHPEAIGGSTPSATVSVSAAQEITVDVNLADTSLVETEGGLKAAFGATAGVAAEGDHTHAELHPAATGSESATALVTIGNLGSDSGSESDAGGNDQVITVDVKLGTGLKVGALGVEIDDAVVALSGHDHPTASAAGVKANATTSRLFIEASAFGLEWNGWVIELTDAITTEAVLDTPNRKLTVGFQLGSDSINLVAGLINVEGTFHAVVVEGYVGTEVYPVEEEVTLAGGLLSASDGFMSAAQASQLLTLVDAPFVGVATANTATVNLDQSVTGILTADIPLSTGLTTDENGVRVDSTVIALRPSYGTKQPNSPGTAGDESWDEFYRYFCVATDRWARIMFEYDSDSDSGSW